MWIFRRHGLGFTLGEQAPLRTQLTCEDFGKSALNPTGGPSASLANTGCILLALI